MKVKQVFRTYRKGGKQLPQTARFCSRCGAEYPATGTDPAKIICPKCGAASYRNPSPAVSVLVVKDGRFLLGKRKPASYQGGKWCLPCGYIEFEEDFLSAARREVSEETGLEVEIKSVISVCSNFFTPELHTLVVVLLAEPTGGALCPADHELEELHWFSPDDGFPDMAFEADSHIIKRYFSTHLAGAPVDPDYAR
jgi:8-oxo-dGTP diphosphatase